MAELNATRHTLYAKYYLQPAFLICVGVLVVAGSGMSIAIRSFGVHLKKTPLPLRKPLSLLDENGLAPYEVVSKSEIENEQVVKELGTGDYIQWILDNPDAAAGSAVRKCLLFIAYYDLPDRVPHVPEECYAGTGHQMLASDSVTLKMNKDGTEEKIPGRHLVFAGTDSNYWASDTKFSAFYLFNVNGVYANSRESARIVLNKNIFGKYSYFCKVEWNFLAAFGKKSYPDKEKAEAASEKLLSVILPILEKEHWPDWPVVDDK